MLVLVGGTSSGEASTAPSRLVVRPGQAQGPRPSPHPPLVPTLGAGRVLFLPHSVGKIHKETGTLPFPDLIVNIHQDGDRHRTDLDWQKSLSALQFIPRFIC